MFRGILLWMAFCLSLVVMWHFADFAAQREDLLLDHYAMEGEPFLDEAPMRSRELLMTPPVQCRDCQLHALPCEQPECQSAERFMLHYARLQ